MSNPDDVTLPETEAGRQALALGIDLDVILGIEADARAPLAREISRLHKDVAIEVEARAAAERKLRDALTLDNTELVEAEVRVATLQGSNIILRNTRDILTAQVATLREALSNILNGHKSLEEGLAAKGQRYPTVEQGANDLDLACAEGHALLAAPSTDILARIKAEAVAEFLTVERLATALAVFDFPAGSRHDAAEVFRAALLAPEEVNNDPEEHAAWLADAALVAPEPCPGKHGLGRIPSPPDPRDYVLTNEEEPHA